MNRHPGRGFTLVELLVVIAIIGILVAILLPAMQGARNAARGMTCRSNLKQIGVALASFESAHRRYPPGAIWGSSSQAKLHGSILVHLLPYIEQEHLFNAFDFQRSDISDSVLASTGKKVKTILVNTYICPSDDHSGFAGGRALHNYAASRGPTEVYDNPLCSCNHSWQSFALAPIDDRANFAGPFTRVGSATRVREIRDGLSNTIFFGEVRPGCSQHARNGWAHSNNGNGYCTTLIPINFDTCDDSAPDACHRSCNWNTEVGFKSAHPGGAHFLLGDGSVHFISETIDHNMYQALGGKNDGGTVSLPR